MHLALAALSALHGLVAEPETRLGAGGPDLTRYLLVCGALVVALGLLGWAAQRALGGSWRSRVSRRSLRVVDVLPIGRRQRIAVVTCYDRTFVLGVGDRELSLVAELDTEEVQAAEELKRTAAAPASGTKREEFERLLRALPRRGAARGTQTAAERERGVLG